jgi:hypothetical protein
MDASFGVEVAVADRVAFCILAAKKVWNVEVAGLESFDTLPADVKETAIEKYYSENAYAKGVVHLWQSARTCLLSQVGNLTVSFNQNDSAVGAKSGGTKLFAVVLVTFVESSAEISWVDSMLGENCFSMSL